MQNSILQQAKVTECRIEYRSSLLKWKASLSEWTELKMNEFYLQEDFSYNWTELACIHHPQPTR